MFVFKTTQTEKVIKTEKAANTLKSAGLALVLTLAGATASVANDSPAWTAKAGTIPVTVTLTDIVPEGVDGGPIYISIQTREDYQSFNGFGGVIKNAPLGTATATVKVDEPGEYAVSIWHDRDNDGRFSMDENYNVLDSWGASGTVSARAMPTFDDVKIDIPNMGTEVTIAMLNPA